MTAASTSVRRIASVATTLIVNGRSGCGSGFGPRLTSIDTSTAIGHDVYSPLRTSPISRPRRRRKPQVGAASVSTRHA
jgi:hypothetical protein